MTKTRLSIYFLLITVVIDAMGIGIVMPVTPDLIRELLGADLSEAAWWGGILSASFAIMQFLFGAAIGNLSDRFGRRPVLLISLAVIGVDYIIMGLTHSIWILLLGRIIGGIASATQATAAAYMADISDPKEKAQNFGLISAAFGVGFVLGPLLGGIMSEFGPRAPFFVAAALALGNGVFGAFILSETVTEDKKRPLEWRRINPFGALKHVGSLPGVGLLMVMFFFHNFAFMVYPTTWAYYTQERYAWTAFDVGVSLMVFGLGVAIVQGGLIRLIIPRIGEWATIALGLGIGVLAAIGISLAPNGTVLYSFMPFTTLAMIATPALTAIMSRAVDENAQGELQGVLTAVGAIASVLSPLVMTNLFSYFTASDAPVYLPASPYYAAAALDILALMLFMIAWRNMRARSQPAE